MSSEGTSTSSDTERMAATESAVNILAQGKRNMVCGEIPTAVNQFQEACKLLSKAYGETAKECADAYFCYGQALLDLARMENGVLGNALQGVPDTDDEPTEQKDEQFEKEELKVEEREKLRKEVYDAMSEKETEKSERKQMEEEKGESSETMEVAMDTEDKPEKKDKEDKSDEAKAKDKAEKDLKKDEKEKKDAKEPEKKEKLFKDTKDEKIKDKKDEAPKDKLKDKKEDVKSEKKEKKDEEEGSADDGEEEGEGTEEEGTEEEGEGTEGEEAAEGEATEEEAGEETTSQDGSQDGENADDISNLQLAWEMLELAKLIYSKDESKEAKLRAAESHLKLGEVSLETEQYEEAVRDLNKCLDIQKSNLDPDNRLLAETYYQLGLAHCFNKHFQEATESYQAAIKVIEDRVANLTKILDKASEEEKKTSDFDSPIYKAIKEVDELKGILPDIKAKIEDVEDEKKNMDDLKNLAKEALGGLSAAVAPEVPSSAPKEDVKASDISHLIKRKRKSEEAADEDSAKKAKSETGDGDAKTNGHTEQKEESMETK